MATMYLRLQVSGAGWFGGLGGPVLALLLSACGTGHETDCLKSNGNIITQRREVAAGLATISMYDNVDLKLVQDTDTYAEVRAGENVIDDIVFTANGDALEITNTSTCNWARSYDTPREVTLHVPSLANIFLRGSGNISTVGELWQEKDFLHLIGAGDFNLNLRGSYCYADMYELGDFNISGSIDDLNLTVGGNGRFFGQGLQTQRCYFQTTRDCNGDAHVRASDVVDGTVFGTGTFYYNRSVPTANVRIKGSGSAKAE